MSTVDLASFNPFDPATLQCPYPHYAAMRAEASVHHVAALGMYLVASHELVSEVLRDPVTFSSNFGSPGMPLDPEARAKLADVMAEGFPRVPTMITADPPAHTRYRRLVSKAFTPKAVAALEPAIREIARRLVENWLFFREIEFVHDFAVPLPVEVIAKALGVPDRRLADFKRWSDDSVAGVGTALPIEQRIEAERGVNEFQRYFAAELEKRRTDPRDDLLTNLLDARIDGSDPDDAGIVDMRALDLPEMLSIIQQLLVAGNETTTKTLTEMVRLLAERPEEWARLRADPSRAQQIVEETLRIATPVQGMFRIATRDVQLGGTAIPKGARLVLVYSSANRDETLYLDPDDFKPDRANLGDHLAFGKGTHFCLGANLARLEARIALEEMARRISSITLTDENDYAYYPSFLLRGLVRLHAIATLATDAAPTITTAG